MMTIESNDLIRLRQVLTKRSRGKQTLRGDGLVERLCQDMDWLSDRVREGLGKLRKQGEINASDWMFGNNPTGQVRLNLMEQPDTPLQSAWRCVLGDANLTGEEQEALLPIGQSLVGMSQQDMVAIVKGLIVLRDMKYEGIARYVVSARELLGSSKLLDALPTSSLRTFGIDLNRYEEAPGYIITAGPPEPTCVVLVENPQAMETALSVSGLEDVAWIATFGYGLSGVGNEYGNQLADFIAGKRKRLHAVIRAGQPPDLASLLAQPRLFFWGDLDQEGLRIFWRLRSSLPHIELSALYNPMVAALQGGGGHPYVTAVGKANQNSWSCDSLIISALLDICSERALDQEAVEPEDIMRYRQFGYEELAAGTI